MFNLITIISFTPPFSGTWHRAIRSIFVGFVLVPCPILSSLHAQPEASSQVPDLPELSPIPNSAETFSLNLAWDSKYVSEGRDNLEDGGIASISMDVDGPSPFLDEWYFSSWYAEGTATPYTELNLSVGFSSSIGEVDIAFGHTWLDFRGPPASDNEFDLQLGFGLFEEIDLSSAFVYSNEAQGTFIELVASTDIEREKFVLSPYLLLGLNRGYIPEEPETFNNLQFGLTATTELFDSLETAFYFAATTGAEDILWTGVNVSFVSSPHTLPQYPTRREH